MRRALDERQLIEQSIGGDREAFGVLVNRYQSLVCAVTYSATGSIERSEELTQEAFLRAWKNLGQLEDVSRFRAWLCTIARNLGSRAIKRRSLDVLDRAGGLDAAESATDGCDPCERLIGREQQEAVWAALEAIPGAYREPMVLFYRRQQSVRQVATDLELSEHVVRQRLYRGRQLLKAEISSVVEETLGRSGPGKAFAVAVVAALPAVTAQTASAAVAGVAAKGAPAAKTFAGAGLLGAFLGPVLGLPGGLLGAWWSSKFNGSPRERRFMIRIAVIWWLLFLVLIALPLTLVVAGLIPVWGLGSCLALFLVLQLVLILWSVTGPRRIQIEEGTYRRRGPWPARVSRAGLYGGFGGAIWGASLPWLYYAWLAKDWVSFVATLACAVLVFFVVTKVWVRRLQRY